MRYTSHTRVLFFAVRLQFTVTPFRYIDIYLGYKVVHAIVCEQLFWYFSRAKPTKQKTIDIPEKSLRAETTLLSFVALIHQNYLMVSTVLWMSRDRRENNNSTWAHINDYLLFAQHRDTCNPAGPVSKLKNGD